MEEVPVDTCLDGRVVVKKGEKKVEGARGVQPEVKQKVVEPQIFQESILWWVGDKFEEGYWLGE